MTDMTDFLDRLQKHLGITDEELSLLKYDDEGEGIALNNKARELAEKYGSNTETWFAEIKKILGYPDTSIVCWFAGTSTAVQWLSMAEKRPQFVFMTWERPGKAHLEQAGVAHRDGDLHPVELEKFKGFLTFPNGTSKAGKKTIPWGTIHTATPEHLDVALKQWRQKWRSQVGN